MTTTPSPSAPSHQATELFREDLAVLLPSSGDGRSGGGSAGASVPTLLNIKIVVAKEVFTILFLNFFFFAFLQRLPVSHLIFLCLLMSSHQRGLSRLYIVISGGFDPQLLWKCDISSQVSPQNLFFFSFFFLFSFSTDCPIRNPGLPSDPSRAKFAGNF